jgi:hypothetical protein
MMATTPANLVKLRLACPLLNGALSSLNEIFLSDFYRSRRMPSASPCILTINGGSSSIRFAVYEAGATPRLRVKGKIDRIS